MTQFGAVAFGESPGHPEKSTTTGTPSFSASRTVLRLTSRCFVPDSRVRMQRVAVAAQRADPDAVIRQDLAKLAQLLRIVQHRELAVRVAGIVAGAELHRVDVQSFELVEHSRQRQLREQAG